MSQVGKYRYADVTNRHLATVMLPVDSPAGVNLKGMKQGRAIYVLEFSSLSMQTRNPKGPKMEFAAQREKTRAPDRDCEFMSCTKNSIFLPQKLISSFRSGKQLKCVFPC